MSSIFSKVTFCSLNREQTEYAWESGAMNKQTSMLSIEEKKKLGHALDDILFDCRFNNKDCHSSDFTWSWDLSQKIVLHLILTQMMMVVLVIKLISIVRLLWVPMQTSMKNFCVDIVTDHWEF